VREPEEEELSMTVPFDQPEEENSNIVDEGTAALTAEAILREHPEALVCALTGDGLITAMPKSVSLWGQAAIEGRALIDSVVAADRKHVIDAWRAMHEEGIGEARIRMMGAPERWMDLHFVDMRGHHDVVLGIVVPTAELCTDPTVREEAGASVPRFATLIEDESGVVLECDDAFTQMFGYPAEELIGQNVLDHIHPEDQGRAIEGWLTMLSTRRMQQFRLRRRRKDGTWLWVDSTVHNFLNQPDRNYVLVELIDVSAEMSAQEQVQEREELLRHLMDTMPDGVIHVDTERQVLFHNARLLEILQPGPALLERSPAQGPADDVAAGPQARSLGPLLRTLTEQSTVAFHMALMQVLEDGEEREIEGDVLLPSGDWRRVLFSMRALRRHGGEVNGALATALDITDSARARQELERRATFDALTHCYNRSSIMSALQRELAGPSRAETAVVYADLDKFKEVNDTLGHAAGDELLVLVAQRLKNAIRSQDKVGRLGGDEFLLLIRGLPEPEVAMGVAQRISESLAEPIELSQGGRVELSLSMGVAWPAHDSMGADELIERADAAMYRSKEERRGLPVLAA
jgi:diguanylate cyclase (GGDEF)-like protein/PAS domain S-box-containing protein